MTTDNTKQNLTNGEGELSDETLQEMSGGIKVRYTPKPAQPEEPDEDDIMNIISTW